MTIWNGLTSDGAVVPIQVDDQGRVIAVGSGPDSPLVVDGDYLRPRDPDLGLGTANIDLDADGQATFAGPVISLGDPSSGATSGTRLGSTVQCAAPTSKSTVWAGYVVGTTTPTSTILADGNATFTGIVDGLCITGRQDSTNSAVFRGTWDGAGNNFTSLIFGDGSATFADDVSVGNTSPVVNSNEGGSTLFGGSGGLRVFRSSSGVSSAIDCQNNGVGVFALKTDGSATFAGNVVAKNISAFSVVLKAALINSDTVQEIKTALTEALAALVPPDASTMPAPEPDASTMPAPEPDASTMPAPPTPESR